MPITREIYEDLVRRRIQNSPAYINRSDSRILTHMIEKLSDRIVKKIERCDDFSNFSVTIWLDDDNGDGDGDNGFSFENVSNEKKFRKKLIKKIKEYCSSLKLVVEIAEDLVSIKPAVDNDLYSI